MKKKLLLYEAKRHQYGRLLSSSDIKISAGFTKREVYYDRDAMG